MYVGSALHELHSNSSDSQEEGSSNATPVVVMYVALLYYVYTCCSSSCYGRGHHVRDGITDWGQYPK